MYEVVVADRSDQFARELSGCLNQGIRLRKVNNADALCAALEESMPDLLVLDLELPGMDAIAQLRSITSLPDRPAILTIQSYASDFLRGSLAGMGIGYMMARPCKVANVAERIEEMLEFYSCNSVPDDLLRTLRIPPKLSGYRYLQSAVALLQDAPEQQVTKMLYPTLGRQFGKKPQCIERAIRNAVHSTWEKHDGRIWQQYLKSDDQGRVCRPSNAQFLTMLLQLSQKIG